jgi:hypothetical protein
MYGIFQFSAVFLNHAVKYHSRFFLEHGGNHFGTLGSHSFDCVSATLQGWHKETRHKYLHKLDNKSIITKLSLLTLSNWKNFLPYISGQATNIYISSCNAITSKFKSRLHNMAENFKLSYPFNEVAKNDDSLILPRHLSLRDIYLWDILLWVLLLWGHTSIK